MGVVPEQGFVSQPMKKTGEWNPDFLAPSPELLNQSRATEPVQSELLSAFWQLEKAEASCGPLCSILALLANALPVY